MENKQIITATVIGLGTLLGIGFLYKYYSGEKEVKKETKVDEKMEKKVEKVVEKKIEEKPKVEEKIVEKKVEEKLNEKVVEKKVEEKPKVEEKKVEIADLYEETPKVEQEDLYEEEEEEEVKEEKEEEAKLTKEIQMTDSYFQIGKLDDSYVFVGKQIPELKMFILPKDETPTVEQWKCLALAKYLGYKVTFAEADVNSQLFKLKSPFGKLPTLETSEGTLWESGSIMRYLSSFGNETMYNAFVDNWMLWFDELQSGISVVLQSCFGKIKATKSDLKDFETKINQSFEILNNQLKGREYICQHISSADIQVSFSFLTFKREFVYYGNYLKNNLMKNLERNSQMSLLGSLALHPMQKLFLY
jgi:glutathione S-transferase